MDKNTLTAIISVVAIIGFVIMVIFAPTENINPIKEKDCICAPKE